MLTVNHQPGFRVRPRVPLLFIRSSIFPLAAALLASLANGCDRGSPPPAAAGACTADGYLATTLYGAIAANVDWGADVIACEGMPRPGGKGARLRLAGPLKDAEGDRNVAFILGIPDLERGMTGQELPTNVTLIEEGSGRFFGTADTRGCWTEITRHEQVRGSRYAVRGAVYCVTPLAETNGGSSISFTELHFSGRLDWRVPE
jgi:hypothetical protein